MIVGVARGEDGDPFAITHAHRLRVVDDDRRSWCPHPGQFLDASVGDGRPDAIAEGLEAGECCLHLGLVGGTDGIEDGARFHGIGRVEWFEWGLVEIEQIGPFAEHRRGEHVGVTRFDETVRAPEMIGMGMGDVDGVHARQWDRCITETILQRRPRIVAGQSGIDECESAGVLDGVGVDVTESSEVGGQLQSQDAACDLGDLGRGLFLFLTWHTDGLDAIGRCAVIVSVPHDVPTLPPGGGGGVRLGARTRPGRERGGRTCPGSNGAR